MGCCIGKLLESMGLEKLVPCGFPTFSAICIVQRLICCHPVFRCIGMQLQYLWHFVLLFWLPCTTQFKVWKLYSENCCSKEARRGKGISVREAERQLDTDAYLKEHQRWVPCRLHCQFPLQRMFLYAAATQQREHDPCPLPEQVKAISEVRPGGRAICCGGCQLWIHKRRDHQNILQHVPAAKVAGEDALWWGDGGTYLPGDPELCQRMPLAKVGFCMAGGGTSVVYGTESFLTPQGLNWALPNSQAHKHNLG